MLTFDFYTQGKHENTFEGKEYKYYIQDVSCFVFLSKL